MARNDLRIDIADTTMGTLLDRFRNAGRHADTAPAPVTASLLPVLDWIRQDGSVVIIRMDGGRGPGDTGQFTVMISDPAERFDPIRADAFTLDDAVAHVVQEYARRVLGTSDEPHSDEAVLPSTFGMTRERVDSSSLHSVGYDQSEQVLEIEFRSGAVYRYFNVPLWQYRGLKSASSKGRYFHFFIRNAGYEYYRFL